MADTAFFAAEAEHGRLAALYVPDPQTGRAARFDQMGAAALRPPDALSGGGGPGLDRGDYLRFTNMLLGRGELEGVRLLGPRTVAYMASTTCPAGRTSRRSGARCSPRRRSRASGSASASRSCRTRSPASRRRRAGEFGWGGAASTAFWVDPVERLTVLFFTQLLPSSTYPIRPQLHQLVHQALVD